LPAGPAAPSLAKESRFQAFRVCGGGRTVVGR
jgi:hypothetical protein